MLAGIVGRGAPRAPASRIVGSADLRRDDTPFAPWLSVARRRSDQSRCLLVHRVGQVEAPRRLLQLVENTAAAGFAAGSVADGRGLRGRGLEQQRRERRQPDEWQ